ncbi:hypothetical protein K1T71_013299 [Dendrolimus kikuchii]|uniref:Uncharacterized protein n=1 Tax=Dendrolimus kikuchii TaxID=765133 RepID=A0ACC1CHU5_9NEOP|nr:hypothetical protein K1T71_013299 [Dendrolimus kikuchii]
MSEVLKELVAKRGSLKAFVSQIKQNLCALKNLGINTDNWDPMLIVTFMRKLDGYTARAFELERDTKTSPTISEFVSFLEKRAVAIENSAVACPRTWKPVANVLSHVAVQQSTCIKCKSTVAAG